jgi:hypothetical protein
MNPGPCIDPVDAARVATLPPDDPSRVHARECPRCHALLDAYLAFDAADASGVPAAELADADTRLTRSLAELTGVGAGTAATRVDPRADHAPSFWERLLHPALRPALVFAALAVAAGAVLLWPRSAVREPGMVLRGGSHSPAFAVSIAERRDDSLHVTWSPAPNADDYRLEFYSGALVEIGRMSPVTGTRADVALGALPFRTTPDETLFVRVAALSGEDVLATSDARLVDTR